MQPTHMLLHYSPDGASVLVPIGAYIEAHYQGGSMSYHDEDGEIARLERYTETVEEIVIALTAWEPADGLIVRVRAREEQP